MFIKPRDGEKNFDKYMLESVSDQLKGQTANTVGRALATGEIDIDQVNPDFDLELDNQSEEPEEIDTFTDIYPLRDLINHTYVNRVKVDTDQGYFEVDTDQGDSFEAWMPYLDDAKAAGIFQIKNPWTGDKEQLGYNGLEARGADPSGWEPVLDAVYQTARESIPYNRGSTRVQGWNAVEFKKNAYSHIVKAKEDNNNAQSLLERLEQNKDNKAVVGDQDHRGGQRQNKIVKELKRELDRYKSAGIIDYTVEANFGQGEIYMTGGGYKKLTEIPESAPYDDFKGAIDHRIMENWDK